MSKEKEYYTRNTLQDMVIHISKETGMYQKDIRIALTSCFRFIRKNMIDGKATSLRGVGTFEHKPSKGGGYFSVIEQRVMTTKPAEHISFVIDQKLRMLVRDESRVRIALEKEDEDRAERIRKNS